MHEIEGILNLKVSVCGLLADWLNSAFVIAGLSQSLHISPRKPSLFNHSLYPTLADKDYIHLSSVQLNIYKSALGANLVFHKDQMV